MREKLTFVTDRTELTGGFLALCFVAKSVRKPWKKLTPSCYNLTLLKCYFIKTVQFKLQLLKKTINKQENQDVYITKHCDFKCGDVSWNECQKLYLVN